MTTVQEKESVMRWVDRKIRPSRSHSGINRQALWCQTVILGADFGFFYLPLTPMIDPYNIYM